MLRMIGTFLSKGCTGGMGDTKPRNNDSSETAETSAFCPIKKTEENLTKKLRELDGLRSEFFAIRDLIIREREKGIDVGAEFKIEMPPEKTIEEKEAKTEARPSTLGAHINPTEKLIEDCIHQTQKDIQGDIAILKQEAKSTRDHLQKCEAAISITGKLNVMIHKIHLTISTPLERRETLPGKLESGLEIITTLAPNKLALEGLLKIVKLANILLKQPTEITDEKLFLEIEKGLSETIQLLNDDFLQLQIAKEGLQKIYHVPVAPKAAVSDSDRPEASRRERTKSLWAMASLPANSNTVPENAETSKRRYSL